MIDFEIDIFRFFFQLFRQVFTFFLFLTRQILLNKVLFSSKKLPKS